MEVRGWYSWGMSDSYAIETLFRRDYPRLPRLAVAVSSDQRARMAVMKHDVISAGLWALASFDPALVHLAELRERFATLKEDDGIRIALERLTSVYLEGQCSKLLEGAGITRLQADVLIVDGLGNVDETALHIVDCTDDPLAMEIMAYALYLGSLTAHGNAPWNRFAATMADCHHQRHPILGSV